MKTKKHKYEDIIKVESNVYMFKNMKWNISLYVDANNADHACELFDKLDFPKRTEWKIFVELGSQPA
tara:strand:- start:372 stop:572 length:201 start_codon:yes stop_codon:yes gene_type:complete